MSKLLTALLCVSLITACSATIARAGMNEVDLVWDPPTQTVAPGDSFSIGLRAVAVNENVLIAGTEVILNWESDFLGLAGNTENGPYGWLLSGFLDDSALDDVNAGLDIPPLDVPTNDGDAFYSALSQLAQPAEITPSGLLLTTIDFVALEATSSTHVCIAASAGDFTVTGVWSAESVGNIVGDLGCAEVVVTPEPTTFAWCVLLIPALARRSRWR